MLKLVELGNALINLVDRLELSLLCMCVCVCVCVCVWACPVTFCPHTRTHTTHTPPHPHISYNTDTQPHTQPPARPPTAHSVVHVLMDFLNTDGAMDVIVFVRAIVEQYPSLRESVLGKLLSNFGDMQTATVINVALWIIGWCYWRSEEKRVCMCGLSVGVARWK